MNHLPNHTMKPRHSTLAFSLALLSPLTAQTLTWDTSATGGIQSASGIWSAAAINWTPDDGATNSGWIDGRDAIIGLGGKTLTLNGANSVGDITRNGSSEALVIGTATDTLAINGIINVTAGANNSLTLRGSNAAAFTGSFEKTGAGQLAMQNAALNFSSITLTDGALTYFNTNPATTTTFALNGGLISSTTTTGRTIGGATTIGGNIGIGTHPGGTGLMTFSNTINLAGSNRTLTIGSGGATFSGAISNGGIIKEGTGNLLLSGSTDSTFTGDFTINAGTVTIGKKTAFGPENSAATRVTVASGAAVNFGGIVDAVYGYTISGTGILDTGALVNNGSAIGNGAKQASNITLAANASIGGTGNWALLTGSFAATSLNLGGNTLTKVGANTVSLASTTTTAGAIQVSEGGLSFGVTNGGTGVNGAASSLVLDNSTGVSLSLGRNSSIGSLAGGGASGGNVSLGANTLTVGGLNTNTTYAGVISGTNGALTKTGSGVLTLSAANSYTGETTASDGTLVINGNISTSTLTTVESGATLAGTGTVGALTALSDSFVNPGSSPGILNSGDTYLHSGSTLGIEIDGLIVGSEYDQLNVTGSATLSGLLSVTMGYTPTQNSLFFVLNNDSDDAITGTFSNAAVDGGIYTLGGQLFQISYAGDFETESFTGGNDIVLKAIPEPRAAFLGSIGFFFLLRRKRI